MTVPMPEIVYEDDFVTLWHGDGCQWLRGHAPTADAVVTDPPYGETALAWDRIISGWETLASQLVPQLWCFGSLRFHFAMYAAMEAAGWKHAQDVIWEKHNGSSFHSDRFRRVHEIAVHWYRGGWGSLYLDPPVTDDATPRTVRRSHRTPHMGEIGGSVYASEEGGPKLMRSVQYVRSEHGRAVHPTQKPLGILRPLIHYSVPRGGLVLDPFAGSGSTLLAAREMGRRAHGCEIDRDHCEAAATRLAQDQLPLEESAA